MTVTVCELENGHGNNAILSVMKGDFPELCTCVPKGKRSDLQMQLMKIESKLFLAPAAKGNAKFEPAGYAIFGMFLLNTYGFRILERDKRYARAVMASGCLDFFPADIGWCVSH